jgi:hypothetical protein
MLIFPWSGLSSTAYLKLDNLKIDFKDMDIDRDLSIIPWVFDNQEMPLALSKQTIHPQSAFNISEYSLITTDIYIGIQLIGFKYQDEEKYNFYLKNANNFSASVIVNSKKAMTKVSYPLTLCEVQKNNFSSSSKNFREETEDDLIWKASLEIPREYFGLDFTISPSFELKNEDETRIYSGGEKKYSDSWIRFNFNESEPIIKNGQKIELQKVYFSTGKTLEPDKNIEIPKELKHEEWWLSTEIDNDGKPDGYVNIDIEALKDILEETPSSKSDWFYQFKRLKQDELIAGVWKVVLHTILVKIFKNSMEKIEDSDESDVDQTIESVYDELPEFDKSALGYFSTKVLSTHGVNDSFENASYQLIKEIIEEGPERNVSLINIEIEKFIDIKKSTELVWEAKKQEEEEEETWIDF